MYLYAYCISSFAFFRSIYIVIIRITLDIIISTTISGHYVNVIPKNNLSRKKYFVLMYANQKSMSSIFQFIHEYILQKKSLTFKGSSKEKDISRSEVAFNYRISNSYVISSKSFYIIVFASLVLFE